MFHPRVTYTFRKFLAYALYAPVGVYITLLTIEMLICVMHVVTIKDAHTWSVNEGEGDGGVSKR